MKTYHIITIGCQMNKADSERFAAFLDENGLKETSKRQEADLVVINTCGVRQSAEDRIYGLVPRIKKDNKSVKLILTGCLSMRKDVQKRLEKYVDIWLPIVKLPKLASILKEFKKKSCNDYLDLKARYNSKFSAFLPIGNGCNNFCTYCVVPYARGREKYRSANAVIREAKNLIRNGYKEITLIAQNVNSYRCLKTGSNFAEVLKQVNDLEGDFWLRFSTSHPKDMSNELIRTMGKCEKLCEHLHLPAQAGNNQILKVMNRKYTRSHYLGLIKKIRKAVPSISLSTDIIVGFPGETKIQFKDTAKLFREVGFDMAYIAQYSPRPGTVAEKMDDNVLKKEKKKREEELIKILRQTALKNSKEFLGQVTEVLVEGKSKKGEWFGKTRTNKSVKFIGGSELTGKFVKVKINKVGDFGIGGRLHKEKIVVIVGTTASGKTNIAVDLADKFDGEVVSADSRQVYRGMDIGSGKDLCEYEIKVKGKREKVKVPYHLIDVADPKKEFSLADFKKQADIAVADILKRGKLPVIAGGTGLYAQALVDGFELSSVKADRKLRKELEKLTKKQLFEKLKKKNRKFALALNESERNNKRRLIRHLEINAQEKFVAKAKGNENYEFLIISLTWPKEILHENIHKRITTRLENEDMMGEVGRLYNDGVSWKRLESFGLEYKFLSYHLRGLVDYDEMVEQLFIATRQFAKRQLNWLRRWERQGVKLHWFEEEKLKDFGKVKKNTEKLVKDFLN